MNPTNRLPSQSTSHSKGSMILVSLFTHCSLYSIVRAKMTY